MLITIDFNSSEAIYMQLRNQIIMAIATERIREGDTLPSVRQLADTVGINMHTVNKAYAVLRQEGILKLDRRHGAIIAMEIDKIRAIEELKAGMLGTLAKAICKGVSEEEAHEVVHQIYKEIATTLNYGGNE